MGLVLPAGQKQTFGLLDTIILKVVTFRVILYEQFH
jgi:hypothetical protein